MIGLLIYCAIGLILWPIFTKFFIFAYFGEDIKDLDLEEKLGFLFFGGVCAAFWPLAGIFSLMYIFIFGRNVD